MELIVFDLDGTLLNKQSELSQGTRDTLASLRRKKIAYTVATGRTLHASRDLLQDQGFSLPHIYKNGAVIWQPEKQQYSHSTVLTLTEIESVLSAFLSQDITPFIFTLEPDNYHGVYHAPLQTEAERRLAQVIERDRGLRLQPLSEIPALADIINISALGPREGIEEVERRVEDQHHLVAYAGTAIEGQQLHWIDVHHSEASKGGAIDQLRNDLGIERVICFGDSANDLSMFACADESYAPSNAKETVKQAATAVIGHHDEDGIAEFLQRRFEL